MQGVYQVDGRILEDQSRRTMSVTDFVAIAGLTTEWPLRAIVLQAKPCVNDESTGERTNLEDLMMMKESVDAAVRLIQTDPHCTLCGGGESKSGNEILLCDGLHCVGCYHQQCVLPPMKDVPAGSWLCSSCTAAGNIVDPEIKEDARMAKVRATKRAVAELMLCAIHVVIGISWQPSSTKSHRAVVCYCTA